MAYVSGICDGGRRGTVWVPGREQRSLVVQRAQQCMRERHGRIYEKLGPQIDASLHRIETMFGYVSDEHVDWCARSARELVEHR
jgi:hypothetical protein